MHVSCLKCNRNFELDDEKIKNVKAVTCVCLATIELQKTDGLLHNQLGKYLLVNRIAVGGMGEIYYGKVSGIEGFEKEVAIKKMLSHLSDEQEFIQMMVKEAKLTVLLNHPNIVGIYDFAREQKQYYIAMEYVPGVTVGSILEKAHKANMQLPVEVAVHVVMHVLLGLAYAHNLNTPSGEKICILHRDITPQNILVTQSGYVKITDFGIAKALNEISTTSPGMIKGKLGYIAPEQLDGQEPDKRADLFCAAILMWEMLAVRRLFKGSTEAETFHLINMCNIPNLSSLRQDISPGLQAVINKALMRNPDDRYPSGEDFYEALNLALLPRTVNDYAKATEAFFRLHPEFFEAVNKHKIAPLEPLDDPSVTKTLSANNRSVNDYLQPVKKSGAKWAYGAVLGLLILAGGSGWWWYVNHPVAARLLAGDAQPAVADPVAIPVAATPTHLQSAENTEGLVKPPLESTPPAEALPPPAIDIPRAVAKELPSKSHSPKNAKSGLKPLRGGEIQAVIQNHQYAITHCLRSLDPAHGARQLNARIHIATNGQVDAVDFEPKPEDPALNTCLQQSFKAIHFRHQPDPDLKVTIPLKIQVL